MTDERVLGLVALCEQPPPCSRFCEKVTLMASLAIEARNVVFSRDGRRILDETSLSVASGEVVALQGPSGCGKSTLLRVMATLIELERGQLLLSGVDTRETPPRVFRTLHSVSKLAACLQ